jgi:serine protease AprX
MMAGARSSRPTQPRRRRNGMTEMALRYELLMTVRRALFTATVLLCLGGGVMAARESSNQASDFIVARAVVRDKSPDVLAASTIEFLHSRDSVRARVWVFFVDKGFADSMGFVSAARKVTLSERALRRRAKVGRADVVSADLPVSQSHIDAVIGLGATFRRSSRWLNAASFDIPFKRLQDLSALPIVAEILPVAQFKTPEIVNGDFRTTDDPEAQSPETLTYGPSQYQLTQINIATAHGQGFSGQGVTLTITDTGFRKTHDALKQSVADGRVLAEYDFVDNDSVTTMEEGDPPTQWDHGTLVWSVAGGCAPGHLYGPAFGANFILCKTEDIASETPVEEDNWVAALEFADSVGTDVISTSLSYLYWYQYADMDGQTAVISRAASTCDALGIIMVAAAGNRGPTPGSIRAPADALDILTVGAVDRSRLIAGFSSRGPTFDGRTKPEVCAMGVDTYGAGTDSDSQYLYASGTSLAAPLIAGAVCLVLEARPDLTPAMVRQALQATASQASQPDNDYGWGIIDVGKALLWPLYFEVSSHAGQIPLSVAFSNLSYLEASEVLWDFGDGVTSTETNPVHTYDTAGVFDVTLSIATELGSYTRTIPGMISAHSDTLAVSHVQAVSFSGVRVDVFAHNYLPLNRLVIPFSWEGELDISYDSFSTAGLRTEYFSGQMLTSIATAERRATIVLATATSGAEPPLSPGAGPVASLYFSVPIVPWSGFNPIRLVSYGNYKPSFRSSSYEYTPALSDGSIRIGCCFGRVGDVNGVGGDEPDFADVMALVDFLFISGSMPGCWTEADINQSGGFNAKGTDITLGDLMTLINYLFVSGSTVLLPDCP